jgi:hypothetical protein
MGRAAGCGHYRLVALSPFIIRYGRLKLMNWSAVSAL